MGLHRLDLAVDPFEEDAFAVGLFDESETVALRSQAGVALDENQFVHSEKVGDGSDVGVVQTHETRPPAAISAALALIRDGGLGSPGSDLLGFGRTHFRNCTVKIVCAMPCRGKTHQCARFPNAWNFPGWRKSCEAIPVPSVN